MPRLPPRQVHAPQALVYDYEEGQPNEQVSNSGYGDGVSQKNNFVFFSRPFQDSSYRSMRNETHRDKGPNINCLDRSGRPVEFSSRSLQLYSIDWLLLVFLNFSWVLPFVSCSGQYQLSCTTLTHSISSSSLLDVWPWRSWLPARRNFGVFVFNFSFFRS